MRPYMFSKKEYQNLLIKYPDESPQDIFYRCWKQGRTRVKYLAQEQEEYFILTFDFEFKYQSDQVFFAACPPFSFTRLSKSLEEYRKRQVRNSPVTQTLAKTVCGLDIPLLTFQQKYSKHNKYIVLMARSHPGESSGSWVMDGLLDWLHSDEPEVEQLLSKAILKVIPMVNPDGVFMGNYRTGIVGKDFNRSFNSGKPSIFPQITSIKSLVEELQQNGGQILAFIDLHGHSVLRGSFIFGPNPSSYQQSRFRRLPEEMAEKCSLFRYISCKFRNEKSLIETARVYFHTRYNFLTFTLENSLGLWKSDDGRTYPIRIEDWRYFGRQLGEILSNLASQANLTKPISIDHKYFSNEMLILKRKKIRAEMSMELAIEIPTQSTAADQIPKAIEQAKPIKQPVHKKSPAPIQIDLEEAAQISPEDDALSQNYDSDSNDADSQSQDLPAEMLNSIFRAIEVKDFTVDSFRTVSNKGYEEKSTDEVIHQEILRNRKLMFQRNTNGFKEMKLSIRRLTPRNIRKLDEPVTSTLAFDQSYGDKAAKDVAVREIGTSSVLGRLKDIDKVQMQQPPKLKVPVTSRPLDFEKQIMQQVSHQIDTRLKRLAQKPRSIFSTRISGHEKPGTINIHPKFLYPGNYK